MSAVANLAKEIEESADANMDIQLVHKDHVPSYLCEKNAYHWKKRADSLECSTANDDEEYEMEEDGADYGSQLSSPERIAVQSSVGQGLHDFGTNTTSDNLERSTTKLKSMPSSFVATSSSKQLNRSERLKLFRLLDAWEEPNNVQDSNVRGKSSSFVVIRCADPLRHNVYTYLFNGFVFIAFSRCFDRNAPKCQFRIFCSSEM